jgi:hypothetical protein
MNNCLTKKTLSSKYSGCLVEEPQCVFACKFGFSFECCHPDHTKFHAHTTNAMSLEAARNLYETLRQKRRNDFMMNLDEDTRGNFLLQPEMAG